MTAGHRNSIVYAVLAVLWLAAVVWQVGAHRRTTLAAREALLQRARDISTALGVVIRSQRRFNAVSRPRLEAALAALVNTEELISVALVNHRGDAVAAAGPPLPPGVGARGPGSVAWTPETLTVVELISLGADPDEIFRGDADLLVLEDERSPPLPPGPPIGRRGPRMRERWGRAGPDPDALRNLRDWFDERRRLGEPPSYPPWLNAAEFNRLVQQYGIQKFVLVLDAAGTAAQIRKDVHRHLALAALGFVAVLALGLGWRELTRVADLRLKLLRSHEMNEHLKEMNLAAAGLAHETRNPLNLVSGLAQALRRNPANTDLVSQHAEAILGEVDRITGRLNEFLDYSRPQPPTCTAVPLDDLLQDVMRTLDMDREDRRITLDVNGAGTVVMADRAQLRQVVFNLLLNAFQAVAQDGRVSVTVKTDHGGADLIVADDGPGVPAEMREDIFRPYVTLSEDGTGLGLAVVRQIALAHGWQIRCGTSSAGGAEFHIAGMQTVDPEKQPPREQQHTSS